MVIFFDIDGTVVDEATQIIPESTCQAVTELGRCGHLAVVNTGRPFGHLDPRVRRMDFGGWICGCGMEVMLNGRWLYRDLPSRALCLKVIQQVRRCGMQVLYEAEDEVYLDGVWSTGIQPVREAERMTAKGFRVAQLEAVNDASFVKFVTFDAPGCQRAEFLKAMEPWFVGIDRGGTMLEFVKRGCSKAVGMERLLTHLGISRENTLAIGDSTNDLPMFAAAGHTVCLGGGMEELKARAEYVTTPVLEDGVAKALCYFGLIPGISPCKTGEAMVN